ncbi:macrophage mannose receptor 1 [Folsomia candida]|uniref:Neurocan core protein n=1 Tax=Folsomia candida TaxID=158441 RepID=A0A226CYT9_FOLCA|nr:macrophage mannose receptor 1 [Folsomia candida]OXA37571.1 Neurocan core protein [Folsomia candida]
MGFFSSFVVVTLVTIQAAIPSDAVECGDATWTQFEDSKCLQLVDELLTRENAAITCANLAVGSYNIPQIVSIKSPTEQEFITNWIFNESDIFDSVWLNGDRYNETTFVWRDGDHMSMTNWDVGYPTNDSANGCMQISPKAQRVITATDDGLWRDVPCTKRNVVVCEKKPMLTVPELQDIVFNLRDNPVERVQLPDRPSPQELWPNLIWRNVTGEFAGLFFRAEGGTSDSFGTVQEQSDNHLVQVELSYHPGNGFNPPDVITVPASGYSDYVEAGAIAPTWTSREALRFRNSGAESRPRNTAVRIWERA